MNKHYTISSPYPGLMPEGVYEVHFSNPNRHTAYLHAVTGRPYKARVAPHINNYGLTRDAEGLPHGTQYVQVSGVNRKVYVPGLTRLCRFLRLQGHNPVAMGLEEAVKPKVALKFESVPKWAEAVKITAPAAPDYTLEEWVNFKTTAAEWEDLARYAASLGSYDGKSLEPRQSLNLIQPFKEQTMTPITITTQTLINGVEASKFSNDQLYTLIKASEARIQELEALDKKPKSLLAEVERHKAGIDALVDFMDGRDA